MVVVGAEETEEEEGDLTIGEAAGPDEDGDLTIGAGAEEVAGGFSVEDGVDEEEGDLTIGDDEEDGDFTRGAGEEVGCVAATEDGICFAGVELDGAGVC